ncbi:hypothetical protein H8356DRAFT_1437043 [Neocallimastix lanati (nom. inval.)]|nr:hypothetical protein H8356DRAFT_1437043 [Neocallimastix sp. JGI-2020a]
MKISLKLLFLLNLVFVLGNTIKTSNDTVESYVKNIIDFDNIVKLHYEDKISNEALSSYLENATNKQTNKTKTKTKQQKNKNKTAKNKKQNTGKTGQHRFFRNDNVTVLPLQ